MKRFSEDHEWVEVIDGVATLGITEYAAEELGQISFVELPEVGVVLGQGDELCVVESVKTASDLVAPIGGTVSEVNAALEHDPAPVNASPEEEGWICRLTDVDPAECNDLMTETEYEMFVQEDEDESEV